MTRSIIAPLLLAVLLLSACNGKDSSGPEHLAKARMLFDRHEVESALNEAEAAVRANPQSKDAQYLLGEINESRGDVRSAFAAYTRADILDAADHRARTKTIHMLLDANELDAALGRVNAMLGDNPDAIEALAFRAQIEQRQGEAIKARRDALKVLAAAPGQPVASAVLAGLSLADKNIDLALDNIERGLAKAPADVMLLRLKADALFQQKMPDKAISIYRKLVEDEPKSPVLRVALAELQAEGGAVPAGQQTLRDGVAAAPGSQSMRLALAGFLEIHDDPTAADGVLREAIAASPNENVYDLALAGAQLRRGRPQEALATLETADTRLKEKPTQLAVRLGRARLLIAKGDLTGARALLDDILKTTPNNDDALMLRSDLMPPEEAPHAITDLLAVVSRQPTSSLAFQRLQAAYLRAGKNEEAFAAARRIADLNPFDYKAVARVMDLAVGMNRPGDAETAVNGFVARNPDNVDGLSATVRLAILRRDWNAADSALDRLKQRVAAKDLARDLGGQIKEGRGLPKDAAELFKPLIRGGPAAAFNAGAARAYIRTSLAAGQGADALAFLGTLAQGASGDEAAAINLAIGALRQATGEDDTASAAIQSAIAAAPKSPAGYLQQASTLARRKQFDQASAILETGLAAGAPREALLTAKAMIATEAGRPEIAIAAYGTILDDSPKSIVAANNLVSLLSEAKPLDRARLAAARDRLRPMAVTNDPNILDTIAWAAYRLGEIDDARTLLVRAKAETAASPELRFHYGAVLIAAGDKTTGRALIKDVLDADFAGKTEARALMRD